MATISFQPANSESSAQPSSGAVSQARAAGQVILFVLWPGAGPVIPELAFAEGVQSVAVQKERDV